MACLAIRGAATALHAALVALRALRLTARKDSRFCQGLHAQLHTATHRCTHALNNNVIRNNLPQGPGEASTSAAAPSGSSPQQRGGPSYEGLTPDDFEELCVIGQGSSGVAKKVRNKRDGRHMVLKVIQFDVSSDTIRKQVRPCA